MYDIDELTAGTVLSLGNQGESGMADVEFDISAWETLYPGLAVAADPGISDGLWLTYTRGGETAVYPEAAAALAVATVDDVTTLTWTPSEAVLDPAGNGTVVIHLTDGGDEKRSVMAGTYVTPGHGSSETPPEPLADYVAKWGAADATLVLTEPGTAESVGITQDGAGTHLALSLPADMTKWSAVDAIASRVDNSLDPTVSVVQDGTGTHFDFGIPNNALMRDIENTRQVATLNPDGTVAAIVHTDLDSGDVVRTDTFAYDGFLITQVRTLADGSHLTITTNTDTLEQTVSNIE